MTTRQTVLLVDDDHNLLDALRRTLHHEPYTIRVADGPLAALRILDEGPVDLVVSDEEMPVMRGTEFLATLQAHHPDTVRIILTGRADLATAIRAINIGAVYRFFTKPCNPQELAIAIRQGLLQRALLQQSRRLLHTVRRQRAATEEAAVPGLLRVERDASGAVVLDDAPIDLAALLIEMEKEVDAADERVRQRSVAPPHSAARIKDTTRGE
jgi:DNA-binding NtrC family response regulator